MRWVMARVLPVPAPAKIRTGPVRVVAAWRCSLSKPARMSSGVCNANSLMFEVAAMVHRTSGGSSGRRSKMHLGYTCHRFLLPHAIPPDETNEPGQSLLYRRPHLQGVKYDR